MDRPARLVAVALGSNLGDRVAHLAFAVDRLHALLANVAVSRFVETLPEHGANAPLYLNGALVGTSSAAPEGLLAALLEIESDRGRVRLHPGAPRTLDLDLVLVGDVIMETPMLCLPHPRFRSRRFVLGPLVEIAPALVDPVSGHTVAALLDSLPDDVTP